MGKSVARKPPIPPISNEVGVINWFLAHDDQLNGLRANFPDQVASVAADIRGVLLNAADGRSLQHTIRKISKFITDFTPQEAALYKRGGPFSDNEAAQLFGCELATAKVRILGYFLHKKYGIDPSEPAATTTKGKATTILAVIATLAVIIAMDRLPYDYYVLLRLFLCVSSLFLMTRTAAALEDWHRWVLVGFAVLYNPIVPIQIGAKPIWTILNFLTVLVFWVVASRESRMSGIKTVR